MKATEEEKASRKRMEEILEILAASGYRELIGELRDKLQILHYIRFEEILEKIRNPDGMVA